jgi:hypothetical protein
MDNRQRSLRREEDDANRVVCLVEHLMRARRSLGEHRHIARLEDLLAVA